MQQTAEIRPHNEDKQQGLQIYGWLVVPTQSINGLTVLLQNLCLTVDNRLPYLTSVAAGFCRRSCYNYQKIKKLSENNKAAIIVYNFKISLTISFLSNTYYHYNVIVLSD